MTDRTESVLRMYGTRMNYMSLITLEKFYSNPKNKVELENDGVDIVIIIIKRWPNNKNN